MGTSARRRIGTARVPGAVTRSSASGRGARWALRNEVGSLVVEGSGSRRSCVSGKRRSGGGSGSGPNRLVLGWLARRSGRPSRTLLAAEPAQSVAVVGPTQSGKTSGLAVPAILSWEGPVLAASVKTDLARDTVDWRRGLGRVWCFDPGRTTGLPGSTWSPLPAATTWAGARRAAADLTEVTKGAGTSADGEFWYATAAKLLAPLLFAAANGRRTGNARRGALGGHSGGGRGGRHPGSRRSARGTAGRSGHVAAGRAPTERGVHDCGDGARAFRRARCRRRGVPSTRVCQPNGGGGIDTPPLGTPVPGGARRSRQTPAVGVEGAVDPNELLLGPNTLYLCAPAHDQRRLRALFTAMVKQVLEAAFDRATRLGGKLAVPLLVVLDEAANIAPLAELDGLAATCAGHGVQLMTVWQDLAQVTARYGEHAATVVNNHRAKVFLSGTSDARERSTMPATWWERKSCWCPRSPGMRWAGNP